MIYSFFFTGLTKSTWSDQLVQVTRWIPNERRSVGVSILDAINHTLRAVTATVGINAGAVTHLALVRLKMISGLGKSNATLYQKTIFEETFNGHKVSPWT